MAGDWIPMRDGLHEDPRVRMMAARLGRSADEIVGKLHRFWSWCGRTSLDGRLEFTDFGAIDEQFCAGFAQALESVRWLSKLNPEDEQAQGVVIPDFAIWNGANEKRRMKDARRKRGVRRTSAECPQNVRTAPPCPQLENIREENIKESPQTPLAQQGGLRALSSGDAVVQNGHGRPGTKKAARAAAKAERKKRDEEFSASIDRAHERYMREGPVIEPGRPPL